MWIMLRVKLPTGVSPPKLSIFWSVPWKNAENAREQKIREHGIETHREDVAEEALIQYPDAPEDKSFIITNLGCEHNWNGARQIAYKGKQIRVFPDEFVKVETETLILYIEEEAVELVTGGVAEDIIMGGILDGEQRPIYDAAVLDGCNHNQALMVALGVNITMPDAEVPPMGWYRFKKEYAQMFCREREMVD